MHSPLDALAAPSLVRADPQTHAHLHGYSEGTAPIGPKLVDSFGKGDHLHTQLREIDGETERNTARPAPQRLFARAPGE